MIEKLYSYDLGKQKKILCGEIDQDVFRKHVDSRHFMQKFQAYGIDEHIIQKLIEKNIKYIEIITSSVTWHSTLSDWLEPDIKVMDFGHNKQRFLPIKRMFCVKKEAV